VLRESVWGLTRRSQEPVCDSPG